MLSSESISTGEMSEIDLIRIMLTEYRIIMMTMHYWSGFSSSQKPMQSINIMKLDHELFIKLAWEIKGYSSIAKWLNN